MSDLIDRFCADYHAYNSISERRGRQQRVWICALVEHAGSIEAASDARALRAYLTSRLESGVTPATVRKELSGIKPFFKWCWQQREVSAEVWMEISDVSPPRAAAGAGVPNPYTRKELQQFWRELDKAYPRAPDKRLARWQRGTVKYGAPERSHGQRLQLEAIVALALYGGLRCAEIFRLQYEDMHYENSVVVAYSRKNKRSEWKARGVPMFSPMKAAIEEWYAWRETLEPQHDRPWLQLRTPPRPLGWDTYELLLTKLGSGWGYHRLRHTAGTEMLRAGIPLEKVSKILGHSRVQQTLGYAELLHGDLIDAAERADSRFVAAVGRTKEAA